MFAAVLLVLLVVVSIALIAVILLQRSEGGALGLGGGGGGFMTARGTGDLLTRGTSILGGLFFVLAFALVFVGGGRTSGSVTDRVTIDDIDPTAPAAAPGGAAPAGSPSDAPGLPTTGALPGIQAPAPSLQQPIAPAAPTPLTAAQAPVAP